MARGEDTSTTIPWVYIDQTLQTEKKNVLFSAPMEVLSTLKIHTHGFKKNIDVFIKHSAKQKN